MIRYFIFVVLLFVVGACSTNDPENETEITGNPKSIFIYIVNDSTFELDQEQFTINQFENIIDDIYNGSYENNFFITTPGKEIKASTVKYIQSVLATKHIQHLNYTFEEDFLHLNPKVETEEFIELKLAENGEIWLDGRRINDDEEFISLIKMKIENDPNAKIALLPKAGTGYDLYLNEKRRIQDLLFKIDPNLRLAD